MPMHRLLGQRPFFLFFFLLVLVGCSSSSESPSPSNADAGGARCAPLEREQEDGQCACVLECAGSCVNRLEDPSNCGACGNTCAGGEVCFWGKCTNCNDQVNDAGLACGSRCVDPKENEDHCGACGNACGPNGRCSNGVCCRGDEAFCGGACINALTRDNCGGCGIKCAADESCDFGSCRKTSCKDDESVCSGSCVKTKTDINNCGSCGNVCKTPLVVVTAGVSGSASPYCSNGACEASCPSGTRSCVSKGTCEAASAISCGGACTTCVGPTNGNGVASCEANACDIDCAPGFEALLGSCVAATTTGGGGPQTGAPWPLAGHDAMHTGRGSGPPLTTPKVGWLVAIGTNNTGNQGGGETSIDKNGDMILPIHEWAAAGAIVSLTSTGAKTWSLPMSDSLESASVVAIAEDGTLYYSIARFHNEGSLVARRRDGSKKWRRSFPQTITPPTIGADGTIYFGDAAGNVHAQRPDGTEKWVTALPSSGVMHAPSLSPTAGALLRVAATTATGAKVVALDATGALVWERAVTSKSRLSPIIAPNGTTYVLSDQGVLSSIQDNGVLAWEHDFATTASSTMPTFTSTPILAPDGSIVVRRATLGPGFSLVDDKLVALQANGAPKWTYLPPAGVSLSDGLAMAADGTLYGSATGTTGSKLFAIDGASGTKVWELAIPGRASAISFGMNNSLIAQAQVNGVLTMFAITN